MRVELLWLAGLTVLCSLVGRVSEPATARLTGETRNDAGTLRFGECRVVLRGHPSFGQVVRVYRGDKLMYTAPNGRGGRFYRVEAADVTGDAKQELVLLGDYGGTYPHRDLVILELPSLRPLLVKENLYYAFVGDFTGDGQAELSFTDHAVGPFKMYPRVLCRLTPKGLVPAPDLMLQRQVHKPCQKTYFWGAPRFGEMDPGLAHLNDLIYTGRADLARQYLNSHWKLMDNPDYHGTLADRERYWRAVVKNLEGSPYWPMIREMNRGRW